MISLRRFVVPPITSRFQHSKHFMSVLATLIIGAVSFGCAPASPTAGTSPPALPTSSPGPVNLGSVSQSQTECTLDESKAAYRPGPVVLTAVNGTEDVVAFDLWRIVGNRTYEELADYVQAERELAEAGQPGLDHPGYLTNLITIELQAGQTGTMEGTVTAGTYAIVCIRMFPQAGEPRPFSTIGPLIVE